MKPEIIRDKSLDWFERFVDGPVARRVQAYFICFAVGYFLGCIISRFQ